MGHASPSLSTMSAAAQHLLVEENHLSECPSSRQPISAYLGMWHKSLRVFNDPCADPWHLGDIASKPRSRNRQHVPSPEKQSKHQ